MCQKHEMSDRLPLPKPVLIEFPHRPRQINKVHLTVQFQPQGKVSVWLDKSLRRLTSLLGRVHILRLSSFFPIFQMEAYFPTSFREV